MTTVYNPPWWARNPHLQTILPVFSRYKDVPLWRQRLELSDGDFIDVDWLNYQQRHQGVLLLIHGLEGSSQSHYIKRMLHHCQQLGLCALVHHHRSCSGEMNRLARSYHSGDTADLRQSLVHIAGETNHAPIYACGYSLGGNMLAKYLGESGGNSQITRAVVVSAPLQLASCAKRLTRGFSQVYQAHLLKRLRIKTQQKLSLHPHAIKASQLNMLTSFYQFDDEITAPLHGFTGADDYYQQSSALHYLKAINTPTLVMHAKDDPFMGQEVIPTNAQLANQVEYELHSFGGHVGFIDGGTPWQPSFYLEKRVLSFLQLLKANHACTL
ncbi:hydrolase [Shewanella sp. SNU WT4]|uniref:hydrolase n=1 Tax=Shewanella sp. SNU WT4 TaxID=2590015 RepID=UPI00112BEFD5|nr:hydrolase [Shewanella sp. SNU WT4]QDF66094.1 hydrolase [Shewanella sp. SNU WT4]